MSEAVTYELQDGVVWLVIDRPEARNAINRAVADGLLRVSLETGVPVGFGVITAETRAQADARSDLGKAGGKGGHKGVEAAEAAVRLAASLRAWESGR